jgi:hypothetical protein
MRRGALATGILFGLALTAQGNYYSYPEWESASEAVQTAYISGAYDSLVTYISSEQEERMSRHYRACMQRSKMNNLQLTRNVRTFAASRPDLQTQAVQFALIHYLHAACGQVPGN